MYWDKAWPTAAKPVFCPRWGDARQQCACCCGAVGLGAIIAASPTLFTVIKYLGALYLAFLGAKMILGTLRKRGQTADDNEEVVIQKAAAKSILIRGLSPH